MESLIHYVQTLAAGILVGKVVFLSFVVAPILAKTLERESFSNVVRQLFPSYYRLGTAVSVAGMISAALLAGIRGMSPTGAMSIVLWIFVLTAEFYCRSSLTPRSNAMRDWLKEQESRGLTDPELQADWDRLHRGSVTLNSAVLLAGLGLMATT